MIKIYIIITLSFLQIFSHNVPVFKKILSFQEIKDTNSFLVHTLLPENGSQQYVLEMPNGYVFNIDNIFTCDGYLLQDFWIDVFDRHNSHNVSYERLPYSFYNARLAVVSCHSTSSWYHWLLQVLSRIIILCRSNVRFDYILINCERFNWQIKSLDIIFNYFGIDTSKIIFGSQDSQLIQASTLIVPSVPFHFTYHLLDYDQELYRRPECPQWLLQELRTIFSDDNTIQLNDSYKKIYISRKNARTRKVINEDQLIKKLKKQGFQIVYLEKLSIPMQAKIFNEARIIIGPHGAGFTNIIFSNPGYILIDLEHFLIDTTPRSYFRELTNFTSGIYIPFYVDRKSKYDMDADMNIPIEELMKFITLISKKYTL